MPKYTVYAEVRSTDIEELPEVEPFKGSVDITVEAATLPQALELGEQLISEMVNWEYRLTSIEREWREKPYKWSS